MKSIFQGQWLKLCQTLREVIYESNLLRDPAHLLCTTTKLISTDIVILLVLTNWIMKTTFSLNFSICLSQRLIYPAWSLTYCIHKFSWFAAAPHTRLGLLISNEQILELSLSLSSHYHPQPCIWTQYALGRNVSQIWVNDKLFPNLILSNSAKTKTSWNFTHSQAFQDVDELVFSSEQIQRNVSISPLAHQKIICSEWVPSGWESKQLTKPSQ